MPKRAFVVIISGHRADWGRVTQRCAEEDQPILVFVKKQEIKCFNWDDYDNHKINKIEDFDFAILKEDGFEGENSQDFCNIIQQIVEKNQSRDICLAIHAQSEPGISQCLQNGLMDKIYAYWNKGFHHGDSYPFWKGCLNPYITSITQQNMPNYGEKFGHLVEAFEPYAKEARINKAYRLREEILTPFIPFHLYSQLDKPEGEWGSMLGNCKGEFQKASEKLEELKKMLPECSTCRSDLNKIEIDQMNYTKDTCNNQQKACKEEIECLAECLEKAVREIENDIMGGTGAG